MKKQIAYAMPRPPGLPCPVAEPERVDDPPEAAPPPLPPVRPVLQISEAKKCEVRNRWLAIANTHKTWFQSKCLRRLLLWRSGWQKMSLGHH